jgi:hypothetical protein
MNNPARLATAADPEEAMPKAVGICGMNGSPKTGDALPPIATRALPSLAASVARRAAATRKLSFSGCRAKAPGKRKDLMPARA